MSTDNRPVPAFGAVSRVLARNGRVHLARKSNNGLVRLLCTGAFERAERATDEPASCQRCKRIESNLS